MKENKKIFDFNMENIKISEKVKKFGFLEIEYVNPQKETHDNVNGNYKFDYKMYI